MTIWLIAAFVWICGLSFSLGVESRLGRSNPDTIDDCFTGDYWLDLWFAVFWPVTLPALFVYTVTRG